MAKGRTTGDRLDGITPNKDDSAQPPRKPVKMTPEQEDEILRAVLNGLSEKKIKAMIARLGQKKSKRKR